MAKEKKFTAALIDFFGKLPGQSNAEFLKEVKALDADDKAYFKNLLETQAGYTIVA